MRNSSRRGRAFLGILSVIVISAVLFIGYINIRYRAVEPSLRFQGYLVQNMVRLNSQEDVVEFVRSSRESLSPVQVDDDIHVEEKIIPGRDGNDIRVLVFSSKEKTSEDAVGLLWIHGGGYAIGRPDDDAGFISNFIRTADTVIVAPDYRLSVDAPYPAALDDCYDSLVWMKENAESLGINADQLFVAGQSAGGGLTAATTLYARDHGEVNVAFQMPIYPMINSRMDLPSAIHNEELVWNTKRNHIAWQMYLGDLYMTEDLPKYASPSEEKNLEGLPPTYTYVGTLDPFYDETIQYINELKTDGVEAHVDVYERAYHGFDTVGLIGPDASISREAIENLLNAYAHAVETYSHEQN